VGLLWVITSVVVPLLIGAGIAFVTMGEAGPTEFWVARSCFVASMLMLGAITVIWDLKTDWPVLWRTVVTCSVGLAVFLILPESIRYVNRRQKLVATATAKPAAEKQSAIIPHIFAKLRIDSVEAGYCAFRIQLTNGPLVAKNVRTNAKSQYYDRNEFETVTGTMAPEEELTVLGSSGPVWIASNGHLTINIYFDTKVGEVTRHNVATHRFPLSNDLKPETLDPEFSSYGEGLPKPLAAPKDQFAMLEDDAGELLFGAAEKINGKPNIFETTFTHRRIIFNGESRNAIFETKTDTGRTVSLRQSFSTTEDGDHTIRLSWNNNGGELTVDGITRKDYDILEKATPSVAPLDVNISSIAAKLEIESVGQQFCKYRIRLVNGTLPTYNIRVGVQTAAGFKRMEREPIAGMMAAGAELWIPGTPGVLEIGRRDEVNVQLFFDVNVSGKTKHLIFNYSFPIWPDDLKPQVILPSRSWFSEGSLLPIKKTIQQCPLISLAQRDPCDLKLRK
jgi:hypothetical protein